MTVKVLKVLKATMYFKATTKVLRVIHSRRLKYIQLGEIAVVAFWYISFKLGENLDLYVGVYVVNDKASLTVNNK